MWVSDMNVKSLKDLSLDQVGIDPLLGQQLDAALVQPIPGGPCHTGRIS